MTKIKTGGTAQKSGQYKVEGTKTLEITLSRGDRVPPYGGKAKTFVLVDSTKHKKQLAIKLFPLAFQWIFYLF